MLFKISQNSQENIYARVSFLIKFQTSVCNFIKEETLAQVSFAKFLRTIFLKNTSSRLLQPFVVVFFSIIQLEKIAFVIISNRFISNYNHVHNILRHFDWTELNWISLFKISYIILKLHSSSHLLKECLNNANRPKLIIIITIKIK